MKTTLLRRKRVILPAVAVAAVAVLAVGGTVWAATADDVTGDERDRVAAAATSAAGGGEAVDVEAGDDAGEAYDVEVRLEDGSEVDVTLDEDLEVVTTERDDDDHDDRDGRYDREGDDSGPSDADERVPTATQRAAAEKAALAQVPGGTVVDVDTSDDAGVAYEVEVRDADGLEWDVELDESFAVLAKHADR